MAEVMKTLGCKADFRNNELVLDTSSLTENTFDQELMRRMRASNLVLGPMLAKYGQVNLPSPGGCAIGTRPMDQHIKGLKELGVKIKVKHGYLEAKVDKN